MHHRALLIRPHPTEGGALLEGVGQPVGLVGQLAGIHRLALQAERARDRTHRHRVVAGDDFDRNLLGSKVIQGVTGIGADALLEHHQRNRRHGAGCIGVVDGQVAGSEEQHPQAPRADLLGLLGGRGRRVEEYVRRPDHPVAVVAVRRSAPLGRRFERCGRGGRPTGRHLVCLGDGLHAGVRPGVVGGQLCQHIADVTFVQPLQIRDAHTVLGQRAGLVGAHDVDAGQAFDRGQLVDQALPSAEPNDADGERYRRHQHQALGHHRNQRTDHPQHRFPPARAGGEQLRVDDQQARRDQQVGDELQDLVDAAAQFGFHQRELAGFLGQLGGVGFPADLGGAVGTAARDDEAARHHLVAGILGDRVGLTGEQRLVDFQVGLLDDVAVDDDLVAGPEFDDVVEHHLAGQPRLGPGLPAHQRFRLPHDGELVEGLLGTELLDDADRAVGDDQQPEGAVDHRPGRQHDDQQHAEDGVDPGEDVGPHDVGDAARRPGGDVVGLALGYPLRDFGIGQSSGDNGGHRREALPCRVRRSTRASACCRRTSPSKPIRAVSFPKPRSR